MDETDRDVEAQLRESFSRLRERARAPAVDLPAEADGAPATPAEPSLPAKLFIGPNATYYDDRWRWMDWRGRQRSWNWAAAGTFGAWFGYRRMYRWLAGYGLVLVLGLILTMTGVAVAVPLALLLGLAVAAGLYGNFLYLSHFRRIARRIAEGCDDHPAQVRAVEQAGGIDRRTAYAWPVVIVLAALLIGLGLGAAGLGPTINL